MFKNPRVPVVGDRPHLFYQLRVYRRRKGEAKGFTWSDYRDLIIATHRQLSAPLIWCWDNLNIHLAFPGRKVGDVAASADGLHLAFNQQTFEANVWLLEKF